jgi:CHAT domain-containing protein
MNRIILLFVTILPLIPLFGQDPFDYSTIEAVEDLYEKGRYYQAESRLKNRIRRDTKRGENQEKWPVYHSLLAKNLEGLGEIKAAVKEFNRAEELLLNRVLLPDSLAAVRFIIFGRTAFELGQLYKTKMYLDSATERTGIAGLEGKWGVELEDLKIDYLRSTGSYLSAIVEIQKTMEKQRKITKRKEKVFNAKTKSFEFKKVPRKQFKSNVERLGALKVKYATLNLEWGDYELADSLFQKNNDELSATLKKNDQSVILNQVGFYERTYEKGDKNDIRQIKNLRTRYAGNWDYYVPNKLYFSMFETELRGYLFSDAFAWFSTGSNQFRREVFKNFSSESSYNYWGRYLATLELSQKGKYNSFNKRMNALYESRVEYYDSLDLKLVPFLHDYALAKIRIHQYDSAVPIYNEAICISEWNTSDNSVLKHFSALEMAKFYAKYTAQLEKADSIFDESMYAVLENYRRHGAPYINLLESYAEFCLRIGDYIVADSLSAEALQYTLERYGENSVAYGISLRKRSEAQIALGAYGDATVNLKKSVSILEKSDSEPEEEYIMSLYKLGDIERLNGSLYNSELYLNEAYIGSKRIVRRDDILTASINESLGALYAQIGKYNHAEELLEEGIASRVKILGDQHFSLIRSYNFLGNLFLVEGKMIEAEKALSKSSDIAREQLSDTSYAYIKSLVSLAEFYRILGDFEKSGYLLETSENTLSRRFGYQHISLADVLVKRSELLLSSEEDPEVILSILDRAGEIVKFNVGDQHPRYAEINELKGMAYIKQEKYETALIHFEAANYVYLATYGDNHVKTARNRAMVAQLHYSKKSYEQAIKYYDLAMKTYGYIFDKKHPDYVRMLGKLGMSYYASKQYDKAADALIRSTSSYIQYIDEYFPYLSENERTVYWNNIKKDFEIFNSLVAEYHEQDNRLIEQMYNNQLAVKAILLNSSIQLKKRVYNYGDQETIKKYEAWLSRREEYARYLGISKEKLDTIDVNLELMNLEINRLEKELSETTKDFARDYEEELYTWKDVRSVLQENDVALEIIRVSHFDHILTDSIIYAALVVTKETKGNPSIVLLPNGTELEGRDFKFFRNGIKYKTIDEVSYKKYWARIESEFGLRTNIYISPDGVYNQINPETFYRENYGYLISGYRFNSIYNTKDLVIAKIESSYKATSSDAILVGNPNFGNHTGEQSITSVEPLPGAEKEVQEVGILLASNNWIVQEITGDQAGEDEIKSVESPRILHLATHGFFMEDEQFGRSGSDKIITEFDRDKPDNMMLKSGLLMAGADSLLVKAEEDINELNSASGVLTAYEAVHLNLDNTELVILSACETGRGEISAGQGVYGLQRSFSVAGARNVIMSLFKVDDRVTQELLSDFYRRWINGTEKRIAFLEAKKAIKESYPEPIFWGSFVMIGL